MWSRNANKLFLVASHPLELFSRSTHILRRRVPVLKFPSNVRPDTVMRGLAPEFQEYIKLKKHVTYPEVEVILTDIVEDLGQRGQIVKCKPIAAYDLVVLKKAMYVTPENLKKIDLLPDDAIHRYSSLTAYKTMKMLKKRTLSVFMNMDEPWTIESWHIRTNLLLAEVESMSNDNIQLPETPIRGPDLTLEGKDFAVFLTINNSEKFPIRCRLRHYTKIFSRRFVLPPDHDCIPSEPILAEQKELLESIPLPVYVETEQLA